MTDIEPVHLKHPSQMPHIVIFHLIHLNGIDLFQLQIITYQIFPKSVASFHNDQTFFYNKNAPLLSSWIW